MNVRHHLKCEVCGTVTLMRTQLGFVEQHPLRIPCGGCGILILGQAFLNPQQGTFRFEFDNAEVVSECQPSFYLEASGEFVTKKLEKVVPSDDILYYPPPFFEAVEKMGYEKMDVFKSKLIEFLSLIKTDWIKIKRTNELWLSGKYQFLKDEVQRFFPEKKFPMDNKLEMLRGVHSLNLCFLLPILDANFFNHTDNFLRTEIRLHSSNNPKAMYELAKQFAENNLLSRYEQKVLTLTDQFVEKFKFLIPVFGLKFYNEVDENIFKSKGITTASFEDLKQFYLDCYESLGDMLRLVIAYNNLKYRGNFEIMKSKRSDISNIVEFDSKSKGIRIGYLDGTEAYDNLIFPHLDNRLRNAIGHNTYKYDGVDQIIVYYPSGTEGSGSEEKICLLEFIRNSWNLYQSVINMAELVYRTNQLYFLSQGYTCSVSPSVFGSATKVGRNEPCPCGSGKKFKKCCGKN